MRVFVDEEEPMYTLLCALRSRAPLHPYGDCVLAAFQEHAAIAAQRTPSIARVSEPHLPASPIEPLSEREREVLHLLADGLSNGEIAARLVD